MARVMLTGRVTDAQAAALRAHAEAVGLPMYQATVRALEHGIAILTGDRDTPVPTADRVKAPVSELERLRTTIERLTIRAELRDRLVQRALYMSCAAYAAALAAATKGAAPEQVNEIERDVTHVADAVFGRQLARAWEGTGSDSLTAMSRAHDLSWDSGLGEPLPSRLPQSPPLASAPQVQPQPRPPEPPTPAPPPSPIGPREDRTLGGAL